MTLGGLAAGALLAALLSQVLVKVLTGVFDPPPDALAVPWPYLAAVAVVVTTAVGAACALALRLLRRPAVTVLRDL